MRSNRVQALFCVVLTVAGFQALAARGEDWPGWRGPDGNGISKESAWNPKAIEGAGKELWRKEVGAGYSAVSTAGMRLFTMGFVDGQDIVYCLNAETGKELWRHAYACGKGSYPGPRTTPLIVGDVVYSFSRDGHVFCLKLMNGDVVWSRDVSEDPGAKVQQWGFASSPVILDGLLVLNAGKSGIALNPKDGKVVWSSSNDEASYASVVPCDLGGRKGVVVFGAEAAYGVGLADGKVAWSYPWKTSWDVNAADPIVLGNRVFIASGYGHGCAMLEMEAGGVRKVWENKELRAHFSSAVLIDGHLYGIDGNAGGGSLKCIEWNSGETKWSRELGFGALMAADGKLIVLTERGGLVIAKVDKTSYQEIARGQIANAGKGKWWNMPTLSNGILYCRNSDGLLVALGVKK